MRLRFRPLKRLSWCLQKSLSDLNRVQVQRELNIHGRLRHKNVLELYAAFEDADAIYFVMQCVRQ
jgi:aurora kinase